MTPDERNFLGLHPATVNVDSSRRTCPVCKASCSVPTLVPIYVRSTSSGTDKGETQESNGDASEAAAVHNRTQDYVTTAPNNCTDSLGEIVSSSAGLRRRNTESMATTEPVPSRPAAISPRPPPSSPETPLRYRNNNNWITPLSPGGHRSSLSHGILLSLQQATSSSTAVPPLHHREGTNQLHDLDAHPDATEYLSRLLLMLASFVVLCLLML